MCGFVGVLATGVAPLLGDAPSVERMRDTMTHRGPDGAGIWTSRDRRVVMGHRRLAIIDVSRLANQPMTTYDGRWTIVFNGEIYNHAELRRELNQGGSVRWRTDHSDTEVLLHAFARYGIPALKKLRGMFAFAAWDDHRKEMWLVRDRIGVKPLYWTITAGRLLFASEIKALLVDPHVTRSVDHEALFHYLSFLTTPAPSTLFAGIKKIEAGTLMRVSVDGTALTERWWDVWDDVEPAPSSDLAGASSRLLEELRASVGLRKVSDVPVGVFLSGGLDSSANAALFSEGTGGGVHTFTVGYSGDHPSYQNEIDYARRMADAVGAHYHERLLTADDVLGFLPRMVALQDEPIADPVCVPVYFLAELARSSGVTVCQVGEGADELFLGYPWWQRMIRLQRMVDRTGPRRLKAPMAGLLGAMGGRATVRYEYLRRAAGGRPVFWSGAEAFTHEQKMMLLSPRLRSELRGLTSWTPLEAAWGRFREKAWEQSALNWMTYVDLTLRLPELLLMRVDKMTMGASLEARVPFLDHRVVATALGTPTSVKESGGGLKPVLKHAARGLVPDEIIDRPKQGFALPVRDFLTGRLGEVARREIEQFVAETDLLDAEGVRQVLAQGSPGVAANNTWYLMNLALWWRTSIAGQS